MTPQTDRHNRMIDKDLELYMKERARIDRELVIFIAVVWSTWLVMMGGLFFLYSLISKP